MSERPTNFTTTQDAVAAALSQYLQDHLPLTAAMQVSVAAASPTGIELRVPLAANINHEQTAFGGSISACGILAGWGLLWVRCQSLSPAPRLVIAHSSTRYIRPIDEDFDVRCDSPGELDWTQFEQTYHATGKARLSLRSELTAGGKIAAVHDGVYVALRSEDS